MALLQSFTTAGQHTYTVPSGTEKVILKMWGPGGGSGGAGDATTGGAGGTGGYGEVSASVSGGDVLDVYVGAQGNAGGTDSRGAGGSGYQPGGDGGFPEASTGGGGGGGGGATAVLDNADAVLGSAGGGGAGGGGGSGSTSGFTGGGGGGGARGGSGGGSDDSSLSTKGSGGGGSGAGGAGGSGHDGNGDPGGDGDALADGGTLITSTAGGGNTADGKVEIYSIDPPSNLQVTAHDTDSISLSWDASGETVDEYRVYRDTAAGVSTSGSPHDTVAGGTTTYQDTGLNSGDEYFYVVTAFKSGEGESAATNEVSQLTDYPATTWTGTPYDVSNGDVPLEWDPLADAGESDELEIYRSTSSGTLGTRIADGLSPSSTSYTDTAATTGTTYWYTIRRITGSYSQDNSQQEVDVVAPATGVSLSPNDYTIDVSWTDAATLEDAYSVRLKKASASSFSDDSGALAAGTTSYTTTQLVRGEDYDIKVRASATNAYADSATVTDETETYWDDRQGFTLELRKPASQQLAAFYDEDVVSLETAPEHTAIGSWSVSVPKTPALENWDDAEALIWYTEPDLSTHELVLRGEVTTVSTQETKGQTMISGEDVFSDLRDGAITTTYDRISVHEAIQDFWDSETDFDATVTEPSRTLFADNDQVFNADVGSDFDSTTAIPNTKPIETYTNGVRALQSCFFIEGEDNNSGTGVASMSDSAFSGGAGIQLGTGSNATGDSATWQFTPAYDIPASNVNAAIRISGGGNQVEFRVSLNGDVIESADISKNSAPDWFTDLASGGRLNSISGDPSGYDSYSGGDLLAGNTYGLTIEIGSVAAELNIDCVAIYDDRYTYNFDNSVDANGYLSGPELYPDAVALNFNRFETPLNIEEVTVDSEWNDVSNSQQIGASNNGGAHTEFLNNQADGTFDFVDSSTGDDVFGSRLDMTAQFSRFGSRTTASPTAGFEGQTLNLFVVTYDGSDIGVIGDTERFTGSPFKILQELHRRGGMYWATEYADGDANPVDSFRPGDVVKTTPWDQDQVINHERITDRSKYANTLTAFGAADNSGVPEQTTVESESEVATNGTVEGTPIRRPGLSGAALDAAARVALAGRIASATLTGWVEVPPQVSAYPGYSYTVPTLDNETLELERVRFTRGSGSQRLSFEDDDALTAVLGETQTDIEQTQDAI